MYARITRVQAPPSRVEDLARSFTDAALPALRAISGYAGSSLAIDRASGDGQAVTFWESKEALQASDQAASGIRGDTVSAAGGQVTSVQRLEILLMERAAPAQAPAFLRVVRARVDPTRLDAMTQATRGDALPLLRGLQGFRALVVSADRQSGDCVVTSVWDSPEARDASDSRIADVRRSIFEIGGASSPEIAKYEVLSVEFVGAGATASV
jgi:heme-degrading monooxygenase HmoA